MQSGNASRLWAPASGRGRGCCRRCNVPGQAAGARLRIHLTGVRLSGSSLRDQGCSGALSHQRERRGRGDGMTMALRLENGAAAVRHFVRYVSSRAYRAESFEKEERPAPRCCCCGGATPVRSSDLALPTTHHLGLSNNGDLYVWIGNRAFIHLYLHHAEAILLPSPPSMSVQEKCSLASTGTLPVASHVPRTTTSPIPTMP